MNGTAVQHVKHGRGQVLESRHKGFEILVAFDDGIKRWVRTDELNIEIKTQTEETPDYVEPEFYLNDQQLKSRHMLEAFRLGIVPYDLIDEFTFGRNEEVNQLGKWLNSDKAAFLVVGDYGSGKSHLLKYAVEYALHHEYAVSFVEMDPNKSPFYKPKRVYSRIVENLRYLPKASKQQHYFQDLVETSVAGGAYKDHHYFRYIIRDIDNTDLWDWIHAKESALRPWSYQYYHDIWLPGLYDYSTAANIYTYLLSSLGWAVKEILGLKGLLLVFDEAESIEMSFYNYHISRSYNFMRALLRTANDDEDLVDDPKYHGLDYCKIGSRIPFLYRQPSGLKLLFGFTSLDWNYESYWSQRSGQWVLEKKPTIKELSNSPTLLLQHLDEKALTEVFEHICLLYDNAYDFLKTDDIIKTIFVKTADKAGYTRMFVKAAIEALDITRFNHNRSVEELLG